MRHHRVGQARHHGCRAYAPGGHFGRHQRQQGGQRRVGRVGAAQHDQLRHQVGQRVYRRFFEFNGTAHDQRAGTATAGAHVVGGRADDILVEFLQRARRRVRLVHDGMTGTARQKGQVALGDPDRLVGRQAQPATPFDDKMQAHAVLPRNRHAPRCGHVGAAVRCAGQSQVLQQRAQMVRYGMGGDRWGQAGHEVMRLDERAACAAGASAPNCAPVAAHHVRDGRMAGAREPAAYPVRQLCRRRLHTRRRRTLVLRLSKGCCSAEGSEDQRDRAPGFPMNRHASPSV